MMKTVIVTGGRDYSDAVMIDEVLTFLSPDTVVQGGANGADKLAKEWAQENNISYATYDADWSFLGKAAGPERNKKMLQDYPNAIVVAFPGGKGTANCVKQAIERNMIVLEVK